MIRIIFFMIFAAVYCFVSATPVSADVVNFREDTQNSRCFALTLNETIAVKANGQTGPGCGFSLDVGAGGEWVSTGGYFDSPPYAWGKSIYYPVDKLRISNTYSFTCSQPVYSLDPAGLPSYIKAVKEEDIPGKNITPDGKRYFFGVGQEAQQGSSFNIPLKYTTSCTMMTKTQSQVEFPATPIEEITGKGGNNGCDSLKPININPRTKTSVFPVTIGTSCNFTSPSPSASPSPSPSASPSPSPSPSVSPSPSPTPPPACNTICQDDRQCSGARDGCISCVNGSCKIPPSCGTSCITKAECSGVKDGCSQCLEGTCSDYSSNMCKCDGMVADMVYPGVSFNFEAFGKVEGADVKKAQIADVTFRLTRDNQVIAKSNPITPTVVESSSNKLKVKASWSTPPPPVTKGATYRVFADVRCKPKRIVASNENFSPVPQALKTPEMKPPAGLKILVDLVNRIAGDSNAQVKSFTAKLLAMFKATEAQAQTSNLQLQTLNFVKVLDTDNCRFVKFKFDETLF